MFIIKELFMILLLCHMTIYKYVYVHLLQLFLVFFHFLLLIIRVQSARRSISNSFAINNADFSLLWIDDNIREYSEDNHQTQLLLRDLISTLEIESDLTDVISKINHVKYTGKNLLVIVSGRKASHLFQCLSYYYLYDDIGALFMKLRTIFL